MKNLKDQAQTQQTSGPKNLKCALMSKDRVKFSSRRLMGIIGFMTFLVLVCCNAPSVNVEILGYLSTGLISVTTLDYMQRKTAS